jgi:hypothetical protein
VARAWPPCPSCQHKADQMRRSNMIPTSRTTLRIAIRRSRSVMYQSWCFTDGTVADGRGRRRDGRGAVAGHRQRRRGEYPSSAWAGRHVKTFHRVKSSNMRRTRLWRTRPPLSTRSLCDPAPTMRTTRRPLPPPVARRPSLIRQSIPVRSRWWSLSKCKAKAATKVTTT